MRSVYSAASGWRQSAAIAVLSIACLSSAQAQTQTVATPLNADAINLLMPFSTLLGTTAINQNLTNAFNKPPQESHECMHGEECGVPSLGLGQGYPFTHLSNFGIVREYLLY